MVQQKGCKKALTPNKPELIEKTMQHTHAHTHGQWHKKVVDNFL